MRAHTSIRPPPFPPLPPVQKPSLEAGERKTGYVLIGKVAARTAAEATRALLELLAPHPQRVTTITADNGTEFHWYAQVASVNPMRFYFATPHHSWEQGTDENTNGLIRQYLPKGLTLAGVTQSHYETIAATLTGC